MAVADYPRASWAALARTAGRYPGSRFDDDLALLATGGELDAPGLVQLARAGATAGTPDVDPRDFDPRGLAWFAHLRAGQSEAPERAEDTAALLRLAYQVGGRRALLKQLDTVWVQAVYLAGRLEDLGDLLRHSDAAPAAWWGGEGDAAHPGEVTAQARDWLDILNRPLREAGLEPVTFLEGQASAFDRLTAQAPSLPDDGLPLVTVVMPVYNPGPSLRTAVRSLLAQTWPALEVLVCDDASTAGTDVIEEVAGLDPRVRVVRAERNGGAYAARNLGIGTARGELVTFNDADDWAHPRRVERQVAAVLDVPAALASVSWSVRLSEEMRLSVMGRIPERINLSSVLFRRAEVVERLGGFDAVRKGGDSEFVSRFVTVLGPDSLVELKQPLSMVQLTPGSLSRDDYQFLRTHPARLQYMADFRHWHRLVARDPAAGYLPPGRRADFPAPAYLRGAGRARHDVDVLVLAGLDDEAPTTPDLAAEVEALTEAGLRVGLLEFLSPHDLTLSKVRLPTGPLAEVVRTGRAVRVLPGEPVSARLALVRDPAAAETMPADVLAPVTAHGCLVVADYGPADGRRYCPDAVSDALRQATTVSPTWLPATSGIAHDLLAAGLLQTDVAAPALFGVVREGPTVRARPTVRDTPSRLRVGVATGALHRLTPAEVRAALLALLPMQPEVDVVLWEPGRQAAHHAPRPLTRLDAREVTLAEFVAEVDLVVVGSPPGRGGHLHRVAATAAAHGCVPVLGPEFREHFGQAALYAEEGTVTDRVEELRRSPEQLGRLRAAATDLARRELTAVSVQDHVVRALRRSEEAHR
jgi:O-antigen biosynthesis protein